MSWYGFALSRRALELESIPHWTRIQGRQFVRYELSGLKTVEDHSAWARSFTGVTDPHADWLEYQDASAGVYRAVHLVEDRIDSVIFISPRPDLPSRTWLASLFVKPQLAEADRLGLLVGQPLERGADVGATVCSCFGVGRNTICTAIREQGLTTTAQVTACLKAGGNCGSCVPEIKRLLTQMRVGEGELS